MTLPGRSAGFRGEPLDHHGEFYDLDFLNRYGAVARAISERTSDR